MRRHELTLEQFERVAHLLPGRKGHVGRNAKDNRTFLNAVFWILNTGASWKDLPLRYGKWRNVQLRFSRWCQMGVFDKIFEALNQAGDHKNKRRLNEKKMLLVDNSIVWAPQHAAGAQSCQGEEVVIVAIELAD